MAKEIKDEKTEPKVEAPKVIKEIEKVEKTVVAKEVQLGSVKITIKPDEKVLTFTEYPDRVVYWLEGPKTGGKKVVYK